MKNLTIQRNGEVEKLARAGRAYVDAMNAASRSSSSIASLHLKKQAERELQVAVAQALDIYVNPQSTDDIARQVQQSAPEKARDFHDTCRNTADAASLVWRDRQGAQR